MLPEGGGHSAYLDNHCDRQDGFRIIEATAILWPHDSQYMPSTKGT